MSSLKKIKKNDKYNISKELDNKIINFLKCNLDKINMKYNNKKFSNNIYNLLKKTLLISQKIQHDYFLSDIKQISHKENKYMDIVIINEIQSNLHYQYNVLFSYKNIDFYIKIIFDRLPLKVNEYIRYMKWIICLCLDNIDNKIKKEINFSLYLTNLKKEIYSNSNVVKSIHCNSGFSSYNNNLDVCIYRKEEWLKVFIHECFHIFNMDFNIEENDVNFSDTFYINSDFLIYESFVEFWARLLNCAIFTYDLKMNIKQNDFHKLYSLNLDLERIYSMHQANKLLNVFNITYTDVISREKKDIYNKIYKEDTNAFCYYVITSILMNYFEKTIEWFDVNNKDLFYFKKNKNQIELFCHYIKHLSNEQSLIKLYQDLHINIDEKVKNMKMILFDIQI